MTHKKLNILAAFPMHFINDQNKKIIQDYKINRIKTFEESKYYKEIYKLNLSNFNTHHDLEENTTSIIKKNKIDILYLEYNHPILNLSLKNQYGINFLKFLKKKYNIKICIFVPDPSIPLFYKNIALTDEFIDANIISGSTYINKFKFKSTIYMWEIFEKRFFKKEKKKIDIFYSGQNKPERQFILSKLSQKIKNNFFKNLNIYINYSSNSDKSKNYLNYSKYIKKFRQSKITIGFSRTIFGLHCCNGRLFQALAAKCLYLEHWNCETPKLLTPYLDYVPYYNFKDLNNKINYFLNNPNDLDKIANNGHNKIKYKFNTKNYFYNLHKFIYGKKRIIYKLNYKENYFRYFGFFKGGYLYIYEKYIRYLMFNYFYKYHIILVNNGKKLINIFYFIRNIIYKFKILYEHKK